MGLPVLSISKSSDIGPVLQQVYGQPGPVFCNIELNPAQKLYPVLKFGPPLEDQLPAMAAARLREQMLIKPFSGDESTWLPGTAGV